MVKSRDCPRRLRILGWVRGSSTAPRRPSAGSPRAAPTAREPPTSSYPGPERELVAYVAGARGARSVRPHYDAGAGCRPRGGLLWWG
ncbi:hypothetical protein VTO73DRAFT_13716 [Trametes versicolor]